MITNNEIIQAMKIIINACTERVECIYCPMYEVCVIDSGVKAKNWTIDKKSTERSKC